MLKTLTLAALARRIVPAQAKRQPPTAPPSHSSDTIDGRT